MDKQEENALKTIVRVFLENGIKIAVIIALGIPRKIIELVLAEDIDDDFLDEYEDDVNDFIEKYNVDSELAEELRKHFRSKK